VITTGHPTIVTVTITVVRQTMADTIRIVTSKAGMTDLKGLRTTTTTSGLMETRMTIQIQDLIPIIREETKGILPEKTVMIR